MGIMDVLEKLSGPEYDEPAPLEEIAADPVMEELRIEDTAEEAVPEEIPEIPQAESPEASAPPQPLPPDAAPLPEEPAPPAEESSAAVTKKPRRSKAEGIMMIVAGSAAVLLIVLVVLCFPYFRADEDPEALSEYHQQNYEPLQVTERPQDEILEPTISETEPENPTIPPDSNPYDRYDFQYNRHNYLLLQNVKSYAGVDVSAYQGEIDWEKVKASGIDFAIIRLGYRGYESGKLVEDEYAVKNLEGARDAGLRVGAYFFSQALNIREVDQEIDFMLEILGERYLDMPIVLDWEIPSSSARTARMDAQTLTDIQLHFCGIMEERGYQPMIYFNWHQSENLYYLSELEDYPFWLALYQDRMTYPWKIEMWQYTSSGKVPGINGAVDLNVYMPD